MMDYSLPALLCLWQAQLKMLHMMLFVGVSPLEAVLHYISQDVCEELVKFNLNTIYGTSSPRVELGATLWPWSDLYWSNYVLIISIKMYSDSYLIFFGYSENFTDIFRLFPHLSPCLPSSFHYRNPFMARSVDSGALASS